MSKQQQQEFLKNQDGSPVRVNKADAQQLRAQQLPKKVVERTQVEALLEEVDTVGGHVSQEDFDNSVHVSQAQMQANNRMIKVKPSDEDDYSPQHDSKARDGGKQISKEQKQARAQFVQQMKQDMERRKQKNLQASQGASNNAVMMKQGAENVQQQVPRRNRKVVPMIDFEEQDAYIKKMQQQQANRETNNGQDAKNEAPPQKNAKKGHVIGNYVLGRDLGKGTFGEVMVGTHSLTGEKVAIKVLEKDKIVDVHDVERVAREIHILKIVRHPTIVQLYEIIETEKELYLIMEYARGGELFEYIVSRKRVREKDAAKFLHQILSGVEYLHKLGICHRDLKPENLLMDDFNNIKIVDFGLSNTFKEGQSLQTACGSPCYAAPEMVAGQKYDGQKADMWSVGVIIYAMVCGFLPFEDPKTNKLYQKILNAEFAIPDFVSESCQQLIRQILTTNPNDRLTIAGIRAHPWYQQVKVREHCGIYVGQNPIPVDSDMIALINDYETCDEGQAKRHIQNNRHNSITTTYYLLLKKHLRRGHESVADITKYHPEDFMPGGSKFQGQALQVAIKLDSKSKLSSGGSFSKRTGADVDAKKLASQIKLKRDVYLKGAPQPTTTTGATAHARPEQTFEVDALARDKLASAGQIMSQNENIGGARLNGDIMLIQDASIQHQNTSESKVGISDFDIRGSHGANGSDMSVQKTSAMGGSVRTQMLEESYPRGRAVNVPTTALEIVPENAVQKSQHFDKHMRPLAQAGRYTDSQSPSPRTYFQRNQVRAGNFVGPHHMQPIPRPNMPPHSQQQSIQGQGAGYEPAPGQQLSLTANLHRTQGIDGTDNFELAPVAQYGSDFMMTQHNVLESSAPVERGRKMAGPPIRSKYNGGGSVPPMSIQEDGGNNYNFINNHQTGGDIVIVDQQHMAASAAAQLRKTGKMPTIPTRGNGHGRHGRYESMKMPNQQNNNRDYLESRITGNMRRQGVVNASTESSGGSLGPVNEPLPRQSANFAATLAMRNQQQKTRGVYGGERTQSQMSNHAASKDQSHRKNRPGDSSFGTNGTGRGIDAVGVNTTFQGRRAANLQAQRAGAGIGSSQGGYNTSLGTYQNTSNKLNMTQQSMRIDAAHASVANHLPDSLPGFMATTNFLQDATQDSYMREERRARARAQGDVLIDEPQTPIDQTVFFASTDGMRADGGRGSVDARPGGANSTAQKFAVHSKFQNKQRMITAGGAAGGVMLSSQGAALAKANMVKQILSIHKKNVNPKKLQNQGTNQQFNFYKNQTVAAPGGVPSKNGRISQISGQQQQNSRRSTMNNGGAGGSMPRSGDTSLGNFEESSNTGQMTNSNRLSGGRLPGVQHHGNNVQQNMMNVGHHQTNRMQPPLLQEASFGNVGSSGGGRVNRAAPKKGTHARYKSELVGAPAADGGGIQAGLAGSSKGSSGVSGVSRLSAVSGVSQGSGASAGLGSVTIQQPIAAATRKRKNFDQRGSTNNSVYPDLVAGPLSTHAQNNRKMKVANDNYVDSSPLPAQRKIQQVSNIVSEPSESLGGASQGRFKTGNGVAYPSLGQDNKTQQHRVNDLNMSQDSAAMFTGGVARKPGPRAPGLGKIQVASKYDQMRFQQAQQLLNQSCEGQDAVNMISDNSKMPPGIKNAVHGMRHSINVVGGNGTQLFPGAADKGQHQSTRQRDRMGSQPPIGAGSMTDMDYGAGDGLRQSAKGLLESTQQLTGKQHLGPLGSLVQPSGSALTNVRDQRGAQQLTMQTDHMQKDGLEQIHAVIREQQQRQTAKQGAKAMNIHQQATATRRKRV